MQNKEIEEAKKFLRNVAESQKDLENCKTTAFYKNENNAIGTLLQYIDQLETKVKELSKGQHTLIQSRRKWKNRYYKEKRKNVN